MKKSKKKRNSKRTKKESLDLKQEYKKSWNYLKSSKKYFLIVITIMIIMALIGFFLPAPEFISSEIMKVLEELVVKTQDMSQLEIITFIIANNVQTSLFGLIFGLILGIFPIITAVVNGYLLGFVSSMSVSLEGTSSLLKLLPHGIFELPAVIIALGLGIKLGTIPFKKNTKKTLKEYLENSIRVFLLIILPLLLIAGIIEGALIFLIN